MNSVFEKLQLKSGQTALILNPPSSLIAQLVAPRVDLAIENAQRPEYDLLLVCCMNKSDVAKWLEVALSKKSKEGALWFAYPKKSSKIPSDLTREDGWKILEDKGWLPVRQIALDESWSALRFKERTTIKELKRGLDHPAVDSKAKTVRIPDEFKSELVKYNLLDRFNSCSFTQRKEWVIGVYDAKKEETKVSRIKKIIESLGS